MADEEKIEQTVTQSETGQVADSAVEEQAKTEEAAKVDYEAKCRELQAERDRLQQEHEALKGEYEAVKPYVDFAGAREANNTGAADFNEDDELPITRKEFKRSVIDSERRRIAERAADKFLTDNPDLKPYEKLLVSFLGETKNLQKAAKMTRDFLESERKKGEELASQKLEERKKAAAVASGLGSAGSTSPKSTKEEVETSESYVEKRKQLLRAGRNV